MRRVPAYLAAGALALTQATAGSITSIVRPSMHGAVPVSGQCSTYDPAGVLPDGCTPGITEPITGLVADGPPTTNAFTVQHVDFFTGAYARQSGQTWGNTGGNTGCTLANCHPPRNVAGVDYPTGIRSTYAAALKDPFVNPISGCGWCPAHQTSAPCIGIDIPYDYLSCGTLGANPTIQGYDFEHTAAHGCVRLVAWGIGSGKFTFSDNHLGNTGNCLTQGLTGNLFDLPLADLCNDQIWSEVDIKYNHVDMNGLNAALVNNASQGIQCGGSSPTATRVVDAEYNAFVRSGCNSLFVAAGGANSKIAIRYNYLDGNGYPMPDQTVQTACHNHFIVPQASAAGALALDAVVFNTALSQNGSTGGSAVFWATDGSGGQTYTLLRMDSNVVVVNAMTGLAHYSANLTGGRDLYVNSLFTNNFEDPTGPDHICAEIDTVTNPPTGSGNVDMLNGGNFNTFTLSGGVYLSGPAC